MKRNTTSAGDGFLYQLGQSMLRLLITKRYMQVMNCIMAVTVILLQILTNLSAIKGHTELNRGSPWVRMTGNFGQSIIGFAALKPSKDVRLGISRAWRDLHRRHAGPRSTTQINILLLRYKTDKKLHLTDVTFSR